MQDDARYALAHAAWMASLTHDVHDLGCKAVNSSKKVKLNNSSHCTLLQQKTNPRTHIHDLQSHQCLIESHLAFFKLLRPESFLPDFRPQNLVPCRQGLTETC